MVETTFQTSLFAFLEWQATCSRRIHHPESPVTCTHHKHPHQGAIPTSSSRPQRAPSRPSRAQPEYSRTNRRPEA